MYFPYSFFARAGILTGVTPNGREPTGLGREIMVYYPFDGAGNNIIVPQGDALTPSNPIYYTDAHVQSISGFTYDYLNHAGSGFFSISSHKKFQITGDRTFAFWTKPLPDNVGNLNTHLSKYNAGDQEFYITSVPINGTEAFVEYVIFSSGEFNPEGDFVQIRSDLATPQQYISINAWNLISAWVDYDEQKVFLQINNGQVLSGGLDANQFFMTKQAPLYYGENGGGGILEFPAGIRGTTRSEHDDLGIWNRILTSGERDLLWSDGNGIPDYNDFPVNMGSV